MLCCVNKYLNSFLYHPVVAAFFYKSQIHVFSVDSVVHIFGRFSTQPGTTPRWILSIAFHDGWPKSLLIPALESRCEVSAVLHVQLHRQNVILPRFTIV